MAITRRRFLGRAAGLAALVAGRGSASMPGRSNRPAFRAAIIGDTGHGNYGHELDMIFEGRENITVAAVADPDPAGRAKAAARSKAVRTYSDYHEMLFKEKLHLLSIAPRWSDRHFDMAMAGLRAGAHLYVEKPITKTLKEADELLGLANRLKLKIAVAHQMRLAPNILALKQRIDNGILGELVEIRSHGKQDHRAGGEDLLVLGVHLFDLMRFFAGDPQSCAAQIRQSGHEIAIADAHPATENIGPIAGDEVSAEFDFNRGVRGSFVSRGDNRELAGPWGMELIGTKLSARIQMDMVPRIYVRHEPSGPANQKAEDWQLWDEDPTLNWEESRRSIAAANARVVTDWLGAVVENRQPICSGYAGMKALEMVMSVFAAGLAKERMALPLSNRDHPLGQSR